MFKIKSVLLAIIAGSLLVPSVNAQDGDEIVVTGMRLSKYASDEIPNITLTRKADFVVLPIYIENDTRKKDLRLKELRKSIDSLLKAASRNKDVEVSVFETIETDDDDITINVPFTRDMIKDKITTGYRPDTSRINVVLKTAIRESDDSIDAPYARLGAFIDAIAEVGRSSVSESDDPGLTVKNVERYRPALLNTITTDVKAHQNMLGNIYSVDLTGFEKTLRWERTGDIRLRIYVPYTVSYRLK